MKQLATGGYVSSGIIGGSTETHCQCHPFPIVDLPPTGNEINIIIHSAYEVSDIEDIYDKIRKAVKQHV